MKISLPTPKVHGVPYHLWNPYTPMKKFLPFLKFGPVVTVKGEGNFVVNSRGSKYINGYSGMWSFALGYDRDELVEAASRQMKELPFASLWGLSHPPAIKLAAKLVEISGGHYNRVYLGSNGSEVVEAAIKIARQYHRQSPNSGDRGRYKILSLRGAYHGYGFGGLTAMGNPEFVEKFGPLLPGMLTIEPPYCYRCPFGCEEVGYPACKLACAMAVEQTILSEGPETMAGFLLDPIPSDLGVIVPPDEYYWKVAEICQRYGILLIADEVTTGLGRAGKLLLTQDWDPKPDVLLLGKIITGGYFPLSALLATATVFERFYEPENVLFHGSTHSGHPVGCAVALAAIDIIQREQLPENSARIGERIKTGLEALKEHHPIIGDVRGKGLMLEVELVEDRKTKVPYSEEKTFAVSLDLVCHGLLASLNAVRLFPPLTIDESTADEIVRIMDKSLSDGPLAHLGKMLRLGKEYILGQLFN